MFALSIGSNKRRGSPSALRGRRVQVGHALPGLPGQVAAHDPQGRLPPHETKTVSSHSVAFTYFRLVQKIS